MCNQFTKGDLLSMQRTSNRVIELQTTNLNQRCCIRNEWLAMIYQHRNPGACCKFYNCNKADYYKTPSIREWAVSVIPLKRKRLNENFCY